jgi:hypothetical protein
MAEGGACCGTRTSPDRKAFHSTEGAHPVTILRKTESRFRQPSKPEAIANSAESAEKPAPAAALAQSGLSGLTKTQSQTDSVTPPSVPPPPSVLIDARCPAWPSRRRGRRARRSLQVRPISVTDATVFFSGTPFAMLAPPRDWVATSPRCCAASYSSASRRPNQRVKREPTSGGHEGSTLASSAAPFVFAGLPASKRSASARPCGPLSLPSGCLRYRRRAVCARAQGRSASQYSAASITVRTRRVVAGSAGSSAPAVIERS